MPQPRGDWLFYVATVLFGFFWFVMAQTGPVLGEELANYPAPASKILATPSDDNAAPVYAESCIDPGPVRTVTAPHLRPRVAVCFRGRQYPLQITSYASGIPYWITDLFFPLHQGRIFRVRGFGLLIGLVGIALTRRLLLRFTDPFTANVSALCIALNPGFVWLHSNLFHHELLQWLGCAAAIDQLCLCPSLSPHAGAEASKPPTKRIVAAAGFVGFALLANIKTLFLIVPLIVVAARGGVRFGNVTRSQWLLSAAVVALFYAPVLVGNSLNAGEDFNQELMGRLQMFLSQLDPMKFIVELPNLLVYWGDAFLFGSLSSGEPPSPLVASIAANVPALLYVFAAAAAFFWKGSGAVVPASCGVLIFTYVFVSAFLYNYYVGANYLPLGPIFGVATATTAVTAGRWLAARSGWPVTKVLTATVGLTTAAMIWGLVGRGSPASFVTMPMNGVAVRQLGVHLTERPEPEVPLMVTTYVLAGIPEAVTGGLVRTIKISDFLNCSDRRNVGGPLDQDEISAGRRCLEQRFERLLSAFPGTFRVLASVRSVPIDDRLAGEFAPVLKSVAAAAGRVASTEADFSGWDTGPVLTLVRVGPSLESKI